MTSLSVELKSKTHLKNVTLTNGSTDSALIEGTLGELVQATFAEDNNFGSRWHQRHL